MLRNYLTIAFRNLLRHKTFSLINVLGLTIGMAACLLIMQYVCFELSYDSFHQNKDRIYRIPVEFFLANGQRDYIDADSPPILGPTLQQDFPEIADYVRLHWMYGAVISYQNVTYREERIYYAEHSFLNLFSYPLREGNPRTALTEPNTVVLTEATARKYFGSENPVGKHIQLDGKRNLQVTGILHDIPKNSHLQFDLLVSLATMAQIEKENLKSWGWYNFFTYILLKPQVNAKAFEAKLPAFMEKYQGKDMREKNYRSALIMQPLQDIHLNDTISYEVEKIGNRQAIYFLAIIALFIVVIAWVNYINLSTAKATERAREVGIRKVIGSTRKQLIGQFLLESVLMNLIASVSAVFLAYLASPFFHTLLGKDIPFSFWQNIPFVLTMAGMLVTGMFVSAFYPAFVLSSFKPIRVLKGNIITGNQGIWLRKSLVVFQFAASVTLIIGTLVVYQQLQFMRQQDLGLNVDQTLVLRAPQIRDSTFRTGKFTFKTELLRNPSIRSATFSNYVPGEEITDTGNVRRKGEKDKEGNYSFFWVDYDYIPAYDMEIVAGRNFSSAFATDKQAVILNKTAVQTIGFSTAQEAINQIIIVRNEEKTIVGVVKDYHQRSLRNRHEPIVFIGDLSRSLYFSLKVSPTNLSQTIDAIQETFETRFPGNPFEYFFLDEYFNRQYQTDQQFGQTFAFFASLAIFIACLGLFGLASFTTTQRTKEIGVRKVLGASVPDILLLLSKDFLRLILIACVIAIPVAWVVMHQWLESYAFRINLQWWLFALPGILIIGIAIVTVSFQSMRAALADPVKSLRNE
ncbi:FtsX-like permease family protein [Rhodocytophaga rosea]|uniref:FtsX-like permease family protein n=1 Tax=Rhodocytophaga rosea TaxID=2704465 RepID=A0A6C0GQU8_9BACT|nr:ABC transporter permease [Rhodocytophaga rosea]QHT70439.1 FtsX-like permease family protein [Rhodocytophaga rosea]